MRSRVLSIPVALLAVAVLLAGQSREARADVSSWMAVGGGSAVQHNRETASDDFAASLTYSLGVGSSPIAPVVIGGLVRGQTFVGLGTDLGVALRVATGGFARGDWGVALDVGAAWRPWTTDAHGEWPLQVVLTGGAPWGFQLALGAEFWDVSGGGIPAQGFFAAVEVDLLRLTVMRQGSTDPWWFNPTPAGGRVGAAR